MDIKRIGTISSDDIVNRQDEDLSADKPVVAVSKEELKELKKENRFYLPVLRINHPDMWPPKAKSERKHFTDATAMETCLSNCCGVPGVKNACCRMDPVDLEHVLGPLDEKWIKKILKWFKMKGISYRRQDVVIDLEEGKIIGDNFFNGHKVFQDPKSYPIFRFQVDGSHFSCKFISPASGMCTIYEQRPDMCRNYLCQYVRSNFLVKEKNRWVMQNPPFNEEKTKDE